jgi:hypothetical protein
MDRFTRALAGTVAHFAMSADGRPHGGRAELTPG